MADQQQAPAAVKSMQSPLQDWEREAMRVLADSLAARGGGLCNESARWLRRMADIQQPTTPPPLAGEGGEAAMTREQYETLREAITIAAKHGDMDRWRKELAMFDSRWIPTLRTAPPTLAPSQGTAVTDDVRDAARYRYLRSQPVGEPYGTPRIAMPTSAEHGDFRNGTDADDAVDAALFRSDGGKCKCCGGDGTVTAMVNSSGSEDRYESEVTCEICRGRGIDALASPAVRDERVSEWSPMSNAPKNGCRILAYRKGWQDDWLVVAWNQDIEEWCIAGTDVPAPGCTYWQHMPGPPVDGDNAEALRTHQKVAAAGDEPSAEILAARADGRAEALAIIMKQPPDSALDDYIESRPGFDDEYDSYWDEQKLRELLRCDDKVWSLLQNAQNEYWGYLGLGEFAEDTSGTIDWSLVATPASILAAEDGGDADNSRAGYVTVPKYLLLDLLDNNLEAANLSLMPVSGIDMIEARGGPDAEEPEDRMAYYLYYATVAAAQLRDAIASPPSQAGVREDALDAARYRWLRNDFASHGRHAEWRVDGNETEVDRLVDAEIAAANGVAQVDSNGR